FPLSGAPRLTNDSVRGVTLLTFDPVEDLPRGSCLEVQVTATVRDLAGTRAAPETFRFVIQAGNPPPPTPLQWTFDNDLDMDRERSGGTWSGGKAVFAAVGGDGRHGHFDLTDGDRVTDSHYVWNTDRMVITQKATGTLNDEDVVTDGRFYFTNFELFAGQTLEFTGSKPARIFVRGSMLVEGRILANGGHVRGGYVGKPLPASGGLPHEGQPGTPGGPGGGAGGNGAWACDGTGNPNQPQFNNFAGYPGEDLTVPAGHAYANRVSGTGGAGSPLFPAHGNEAQLIYRAFDTAVESGAGGGGGGFVVAGGTGSCPEAGSVFGDPRNTNPGERGPGGAGGRSF